MSNIKVSINEATFEISSNWTVSDLSTFWKKQKNLDPEVRILCWKQQIIQGIAKKVEIPSTGTLASHGVKQGAKLFPEMDDYQLYMIALKKKANNYLQSGENGAVSTVEVNILKCDSLKLPQTWKKQDLDRFFHTVHGTPEQQPNMPPVEIWARCFIAGWRVQRKGLERVDAKNAPQFEEGIQISPYCTGKTASGQEYKSTAPTAPGVPMAPRPPGPMAPPPPMSPAPPAMGPPPPAPTAAATVPSVPLREFIGGGDILDPRKTLSENGVQSGDSLVAIVLRCRSADGFQPYDE